MFFGDFCSLSESVFKQGVGLGGSIPGRIFKASCAIEPKPWWSTYLGMLGILGILCKWSSLVYSPSSWNKEDYRIVGFSQQVVVFKFRTFDVFFHLQSPWSRNNSFSPSPVKVHVSSVHSFPKLFPDSHDLSAHFAILKEKKIITWAGKHLLVISLYWLLNHYEFYPSKKGSSYSKQPEGLITKPTTPKTLCQCWSS